MTHHMKLAGSTAMALALAMAGAAATAQETADPVFLGRIVLGYTTDGTPVYAGENTSILEDSAISAQGGAASIDEVLRQTPGVNTRQDVGQPGVAVSIRGMQGQGRVAMTIEGVPQNYRFNSHASEGYAYVEDMFLSGVDITRGAVVTTGGTGTAGQVNFRLLRPEDLVDGEGWGSIARLTYGDSSESVDLMLGTAYVQGDWAFLGAVAGHQADEYADGDGVVIDNSDIDVTSYMLRAEYQIDGAQSLDVLAYRQSSTFAANSYEQSVDSTTVQLGYDLSASDLVNLNANLFYTQTTNEYLESLTGTGTYAGRVMEVTTVGMNATNVSHLRFGNWDLTSSNGFEFIHDELGGNDGGASPTEGSGYRLALFSENVFANGPWEVTGALRYNIYQLDGSFDGGGPNPAGEVDIDETSLDPKLTLAYQANDWLQPYLSLYQTTRVPTHQETLQNSYHNYGFFAFYLGPNPDLVPETAIGGEIGFNVDADSVFVPGDRLSGRVAYYQMDVDDYIAYSSNAAGDLFIYDNIPGTTEVSGLEIEATYDTDRMSIAMSYTNSDSTPPAGYEGLQLQPEQTYSATVAGYFLDGTLTAGVTYSYTSSGVSIDNEDPTDSYDLWDVFASYDVSDTLTVTAKVTNLEDDTYTPWAALENGPGRSVYLGAEFRF